ncbi:MAG: methionyl-tRNA formyltransferase [Candidatus Omnitrophica bacterium]|nr:methionyl-tRNA formyltransferase [Candidatus Omnitrophota bacterium]
MKIVFIGSVEIGLKCLRQVVRDKWKVAAVFTLAKKYARTTSGYVDFSPFAKKAGIKVFKIKNVNDPVNVGRIRKINPDLIIICGCQSLVSKEILDIPGSGTVGFHSSLLPKYRGRAPVNWAIIKGETKTGITMFYCCPDPDAGDIIAQKSFPIMITDTCRTVYGKSAGAACELLHGYLSKIKDGTVKRKKNISNRYPLWPKRRPEDGRIDWSKDSLVIHNWIRALTRPYPGAFTYSGEKKYFIWRSRFSRQKRCGPGRPGEIIKVTGRSDNRSFLVKTGKGDIWISDVIYENGRAVQDLSVGSKFS